MASQKTRAMAAVLEAQNHALLASARYLIYSTSVMRGAGAVGEYNGEWEKELVELDERYGRELIDFLLAFLELTRKPAEYSTRK